MLNITEVTINNIMVAKNTSYILIENIEQTPYTELADKEFSNNILKFGSYASIIKNKPLNLVSLVVELINDINLQKDFCNYFSCDTFQLALNLIFGYNTQLIKSKTIKDNLKKWYNNGIRQRKKSL